MNRLLAWTRRNTRRAAALALAPGLAVLALDAWIEHFFANAGDDPLQWIPVGFGIAAAVLLIIVALLRSRAAFAWVARILGALGVVVGLAGAVFHILPIVKEMDGVWDLPTLQGAVGSAGTPVFAPLAFAGLGALVFMLASPKLLLRYRVGRPSKDQARVVPLSDGHDQRRAS